MKTLSARRLIGSIIMILAMMLSLASPLAIAIGELAGPWTVTYNYNNGTSPLEISRNDGQMALQPTIPTWEGHTFVYWYRLVGGVEEEWIFTTPVTEDIILDAKWIPIDYSITYNLDGGTNHPDNPAAYTIEDEVTFEDPDKQGYRFLGWYDTVSFACDPVSGIDAGSTGDVEIWAKWAVEYNIIYNYNLDGAVDNDGNPDSYILDETPFVLATPTSLGYNFLGWYDAGDTQITVIGIGDIELWAKWEAKTYDIIYNLNGGELPDDTTCTYTIEDNVVLAIPTNLGYSFLGWYDNVTLDGGPITEITEGSTGTVALWASWAIEEYGITYYLDGGVNHEDNPDAYTIEDTPIELNAPDKTGYDFLGWYDDATFAGVPLTEIAENETGDIELYAKWVVKVIPYTVTFNSNGGSTVASVLANHGDKITKPTPDPTLANNTFAGWYKDLVLTVKWDFDDDVVTANTTLYAKWTPIGDGGSSSSSGGNSTPVITPEPEIPEPETPVASAFPFTDVVEGNWFYEHVHYMWEGSYMNGTADTLFSPQLKLTRGMVVTVLYRIEGSPDVSELTNPFSDVDEDMYYADAVIWAAEKGIVLGYGDSTYGPKDNVTREQLATILFRYQEVMEKTLVGSGKTREFADADLIHDYAKESVVKLVSQGIIEGRPNDMFDPRGNATRAEFATMLHRYLNGVEIESMLAAFGAIED